MGEMRRYRRSVWRIAFLAALLAGLSACGGASASTRPARIAFGIDGGNIVPYHFTIEPTGVIRTSGPRQPKQPAVSRTKAASLSRLVRTYFSHGVKSRQCRGTNPDIASHFIRVDGRTVTIHGTCEPRFQRLWSSLARAVGINTSGG